MIIVGFESKRLFRSTTGFGAYSRTLVKGLAKHYPNNKYVLLPDQSNETASQQLMLHTLDIEKVLNKGLVYLKLDEGFYKIKRIEMRKLDMKFHCKEIGKEKEYEVKFRANPKMFSALVTFGLEDKKHSIFMIMAESSKLNWFETSIEELIKQIDEKEVKEDIRRELEIYDDLEESQD